MSVCQKCGDKGYTKHLIYCAKCQGSSEHSYCMDILRRKGDENFIWTCEECSSRNTKSSPNPSIKSARISQAVEIRLNRIKMRRQTSFSTVKAQACADTDSLTNAKKPTGDCQKEKIERLPSSFPNIGNEEFKKPKRRLVLEDCSSDEESESVKLTEVDPCQPDHAVSAYPLNISSEIPYSEANRYVHAQPIIDPIWGGSFRIQNKKNSTFFGLVAHLSSKACTKAEEVAKALPMRLNVAIVSRSEAWPQRFQIEPPTDESIALYFFPQHERDEKVFDDLMDDLIIHDQALKAVINNVELLVFSSRELPPEHWRKLFAFLVL
ncbi:hypothetical protein GH714_021286 [Hevea brasiliensis]|uniref:AIPP2-like SPOC-like domain-containing protein n=1 Tax=Hevea brasiliensis TaxID=3981 RepID=A0A6A6K8L4_HEVBR|nr:hypothetical protein GH714_021286 [Hevea brasiliensis]